MIKNKFNNKKKHNRIISKKRKDLFSSLFRIGLFIIVAFVTIIFEKSIAEKYRNIVVIFLIFGIPNIMIFLYLWYKSKQLDDNESENN